jgi:hypothetical protein
MGAWGHKPFQNDSALDWAAELEAVGPRAVRAALSRCEGKNDLDVDDGSAAVGAAALVAAALDGDVRDLPISVRAAVDSVAATPADAALAARALTRVLSGPSELPALWGAGSDWHVSTEQLIQRLGRLAAP